MTRARSATSRWGIYGGQDPRDVGTYSTSEIARYLRVPLRTIHNWTVGFNYAAAGAKKSARPLIEIADPDTHLLSFWNVAELHVLDSLRTYHRIPTPKLRVLISYLEDTFDTAHPLVNERMFTDGTFVFVEKAGKLINVTQAGQYAMRQLLDAHLQRIDQDVDGLAIRLFPFVRRKPDPNIEQSLKPEPKIISLDPRVRFGRPVIVGTSIPTAEIAERFRAGDSLSDLADEYGRPKAEIEEAIRCELTLENAA